MFQQMSGVWSWALPLPVACWVCSQPAWVVGSGSMFRAWHWIWGWSTRTTLHEDFFKLRNHCPELLWWSSPYLPNAKRVSLSFSESYEVLEEEDELSIGQVLRLLPGSISPIPKNYSIAHQGQSLG